MKLNQRTINGFEFIYNNVNCIGILSIVESDIKKTKYVIAKVYICKNQDLSNTLIIYPSWKGVSISPIITSFYEFFEITDSYNGDHFKQLKEGFISVMDPYINPMFNPNLSPNVERVATYIHVTNDPTDPNKKYCIGIKLNGLRKMESERYAPILTMKNQDF